MALGQLRFHLCFPKEDMRLEGSGTWVSVPKQAGAPKNIADSMKEVSSY